MKLQPYLPGSQVRLTKCYRRDLSYYCLQLVIAVACSFAASVCYFLFGHRIKEASLALTLHLSEVSVVLVVLGGGKS